MDFVFHILITSGVVTIVLWIAKTQPSLGGFILSLPISTLLALAISKIQTGSTENTVLLAKSTFAAVPLSLLFFVPFLFSEKLKLPFWGTYALGILLLVISYALHRWITKVWF